MGQGGTGTAVPGANPNTVCNAQLNIRSGGNNALKPEKSKNFSFGFVVEPLSNVTASIDYWNIHISQSIGGLPESTIFNNIPKYIGLFTYNSPTNPTSLLYVNDQTQNLGDTRTNGFDLNATFRMPKTALGNFTLVTDGTYVNKYEYQTEKNGTFTQNAGTYADNGPVFRFKNNLSLNWNQGVWSGVLLNTYESGYHDQNANPLFTNNVKVYSIWGISGTYNGFKNLNLSAGVKNLLNTAPPFTNQGTLFAVGWDPRFADPNGRTLWVRATYKFQ